MENNQKSTPKKHNHAVVISYLFSKKGDLAKSVITTKFTNVKEIKDKLGEELDFSKLCVKFLSEPPCLESNLRKKEYEVIDKDEYDKLKRLIEEAKEKDLVKVDPLPKWKNEDSKYIREWPIWGEYDNDNRRIILYINNILDCCTDKDGKSTDDDKFEKCKRITKIHEEFHAYFHFVTEQNIHRSEKYNYIFEIEEAMAEFCTLVFLQKQGDEEVFDFAYTNIKKNQDETGNLAAYGFGAYLYDNLKEDERLDLINNYIKKLGNIKKADDKVKEYKQKVRLSKFVAGNQKHCLKLLQEILKPN